MLISDRQGGITLGRFALSHLAHRIGEKKFTYFLIAGSCAFQLLVWFIPNVIGDAGECLGLHLPIATLTDVPPKWP